jgi:hypothetical protein
MEIPNLDRPTLILPKNHVRKTKAVMAWFRDTDARLARFVKQGVLKLEMAQAYYASKVETNEVLSKADKQILANESKVWRIPNPNLN